MRSGRIDSLAIITLTGPDGDAALDRESDRPVAIVRDSRTGRVRRVLRSESAVEAQVAPAEPGVAVHFSRGIPDDEARR